MTKIMEYFLNTKPVNDIKELLVYMITKGFFSKKVVFELHYHKKRQYGEFQTGKNRSQEIEYTINQSPTVV